MKYLRRIFNRRATAELVKRALREDRYVSFKAITACLDLLAGALGRNWYRASREAAAGMVLVMLAKEAKLGDYVNDLGWNLVLTFVGENAEIVRYLSPRAMTEISARQAVQPGALLAAVV
jgi:hypothetical protein